MKKGFEFTLMVVGKRLTCALGLLNLWVPPFPTLGCDSVGSRATGFLRGQRHTPREFGEIPGAQRESWPVISLLVR